MLQQFNAYDLMQTLNPEIVLRIEGRGEEHYYSVYLSPAPNLQRRIENVPFMDSPLLCAAAATTSRGYSQ